jgi:hypothetical protein
VLDASFNLNYNCGHDFPPKIREAAYRFVDRHLKKK